jgi:glycosyltransferase involved in cell wall biosynthesis
MISVIVPNYNHAKYLVQRLDSILRQTYQNFEIIILDDCSTDNSRDIIERYRNDPHISAIIYNETNSGSTFKQWKKGLELVKGDYVWIAESDDVASADFLEKMTALIEEKQAMLAFCDSTVIDETGVKIRYSWIDTSFSKGKAFSVYDGNTFLKKYLVKGNVIYNASAVIFNKAKALEIFGFEEYQFCGDWFFWSRIILNSQIIFLNEKLNYFRQHTQKVSSGALMNGLRYFEGFNIVQYILKTLCMNHVQSMAIAGLYWYKIKLDQNIASEVIRNKCFTEWKNIFDYPKIACMLFFPFGIKIRYNHFMRLKSYFEDRISERGILGTFLYYQRKYIKKYD